MPLPGTELFDDAVIKGFKAPEKLEDWVYCDFEDFHERRNIVRPWISDIELDFVEKAIVLVEKLNHEFIEKGANLSKINQLLQDIKANR